MTDTKPQLSSPPLRDCVGSLLLAYKVLRTVPWTNKSLNDDLLKSFAVKGKGLGERIEKAIKLRDPVRIVDALHTEVTDYLRLAWDCAGHVYELDKLFGAKEFVSRYYGLKVLMKRYNMVLFSLLLWYASKLLFNNTCCSDC